MTKLNEQQQEVQRFVQRYIKRTRKSPRLVDIIAGCASVKSKTIAHRVVEQLVDLGYLDKEPDSPRRLVLSVARTIQDEPYDPFEDAAKAACEAAGVGADKIPLVREAIAQTLTRAA